MPKFDAVSRVAVTLSLVLAGAAYPGAASAAFVKLITAGNSGVPSGDWCNTSTQSVAPNGTVSVRLEGAMDTTSRNSDNGKYRIKTQTDKFEWSSGSEPALTFQQQSSAASYNVKAKSSTAANTYTINFVAVDSTGAESPVKSCKITVTGASGSPDLQTTFTAFTLDSGTAISDPQNVPSGNKVKLKVKVANIGSGGAAAVKLSVNRFDHTCGGTSVAVGTKDVSALAASANSELEFQDNNPPTPSTAAKAATSVTVCYKTGINTSSGGYYTDANNNNHRSERGARFVATSGTTPPAVLFGDYLNAKFSHAKCLDCHSFTNTSSTRRSAHSGRFGANADVTSSATCSGCHTPATGCAGSPGCVASGWHAPASSMNWSGKTAKETCVLIKSGAFATASSMKSHLKNDTLILWALGRQNVTTTEWNGKVDAWVDGGMKCE